MIELAAQIVHYTCTPYRDEIHLKNYVKFLVLISDSRFFKTFRVLKTSLYQFRKPFLKLNGCPVYSVRYMYILGIFRIHVDVGNIILYITINSYSSIIS